MLPPHAHTALKAHVERPLELLSGRRAVQPASIHGARKQLKRARASLRLLRDAVGKRAYREENRRLRDAARPLAPTRDTDVMITTLSVLLAERAFRTHRPTLTAAKKALAKERSVLATRVPVASIRMSLEASRARVTQWRMPHDSLPIARAGLERIYRRGRKALKRALERPTEARLHELRKQVKYLGAALQTLEPEPRASATRVVEHSDTIAELLGADHDLSVLRKRFADRALTRMLLRRREPLQKEALRAARRLYRRKPAAFTAHILQP